MLRTGKYALAHLKRPLVNYNQFTRGLNSTEVIERELKYGAHNYDTVPVALCRGKGMFLDIYLFE